MNVAEERAGELQRDNAEGLLRPEGGRGGRGDTRGREGDQGPGVCVSGRITLREIG